MTVYPRTMGKQINVQFTNTIRYLGLVLFTKRKWEIWQGRPVCVCVCLCPRTLPIHFHAA